MINKKKKGKIKMKIFNIEITETLQKTISVEANSEEEALRIIRKKYSDEEIVLDESDLITTHFNIIK